MEGNDGKLEGFDDEDNENKSNSTEKYNMSIEEAVERTIDDCIREDILVDILTKFRAEVKKLSIFEYNARLHEETLKKEGYEDGLEEGRIEGRAEGRIKGRAEGRKDEREEIIQNAFRKGYTPEQIAEFTGAELEEVMKVREKMLQGRS